MTTYIYHLLDSRRRVRYVGKSRNPTGRLASHFSRSRRPACAVEKWVQTCLEGNDIPRMKVVRTCTGDGAVEERDEISKALAKGCPLLNVQGNLPEEAAARNARSDLLNCYMIAKLRVALGLSQREASVRARMCSHTQWNDIETGRRSNLTLNTLGLIAIALECDARILLKPTKRKRGAK